MDELKLTGNCLLGSRPLLSFDSVRLWKGVVMDREKMTNELSFLDHRLSASFTSSL